MCRVRTEGNYVLTRGAFRMPCSSSSAVKHLLTRQKATLESVKNASCFHFRSYFYFCTHNAVVISKFFHSLSILQYRRLNILPTSSIMSADLILMTRVTITVSHKVNIKNALNMTVFINSFESPVSSFSHVKPESLPLLVLLMMYVQWNTKVLF